jgi:acetyltransferase-like isoleucine patch superfamily enzyme
MVGLNTPNDLLELLKACYQAEDKRLRSSFNRSLPFQDAVFDRWERARQLGFGNGASIYNSAAVFGQVLVGQNTWVGPYVVLDGSGGGVAIGAFCSISAGVHIYTHDTVLWALSRGEVTKREACVSIADCVYIGSQSVIAAGVTIGAHSVIAANSFVNGHVPERTVVGGNPARRLGVVVGQGAGVFIEYDSGKQRDCAGAQEK